MKMSKALKILFITYSLLVGTAPSYAQEKSEKSTGFFGWASGYIPFFGKKSKEEQAAIAANNYLPEGSTFNPQDFVYCGGGVVQEVQLNGINDLVAEFENMCKADVSSFHNQLKTRGIIGFCGYVKEKIEQGSCYTGVESTQEILSYEEQFLKNPALKRKFIEVEKEQLRKEREKFKKLSGFQLMISQDANTLLRIKAQLQDRLKNNNPEFLNTLKNTFHLEDNQVDEIRSGSVSLANLSDMMFQCKPSMDRRDDNKLDEAILDQPCGEENSESNDLVKEAYDELIAEEGDGVGLMFNHVSDTIVGYSDNFIDDDYKNIINSLNNNYQDKPGMEALTIASQFHTDSNEILTMMDADREDGKPFEITRIVDDLLGSKLSAPGFNYESSREEISAIKKQANQASLKLTLSSLERSYANDETSLKVINAIKSEFISEQDGNVEVDFKGEEYINVITKISDSLGPEYNGRDWMKKINEFSRFVVVGANMGAQMVGSKINIHSIGAEINQAASNQSPSDFSPFTSAYENSDHQVLKMISNYFDNNREIYDIDFKNVLHAMDKSTGGMCKSEDTNTAIFTLGLVEALAIDCNNLVNRSKSDIDKRHCPVAGNTNLAKRVISDLASNTRAFSDVPSETLRDISVGCDFINAETELFNAPVLDGLNASKGAEGLASTEPPAIPSVCGVDIGPPTQLDLMMREKSLACRYFRHDADRKDDFIDNSKGYSGILDGGSSSGLSGFPKAGEPVDNPIGNSIAKQEKKGIYSKGSYSNNKFAENYSGKMAKEPDYIGATSTPANNASTYSSTVGSGINSNIFDTKKSFNPTENSIISNIDTMNDKKNDITREELESEIIAKNGAVDPNIQKILDRMSAMEAREKELMSKQSQLLAQLDNPNATGAQASASDSEAQQQLASVTKELEELKKQIPDLVAKARDKGAEVKQRSASNFVRPSAVATPSGGASRGPASQSNSVARQGIPSSFSSPASSGGGSAASSSGGGQSFVKAGAGVSSVSADGVSAPAYTQNETFVLTQSIRDKAELVAAGVSIEDAVLQSKGAILVPYGNGQYMYVEPEINANGDVETRDGRVVYKEVLKVSDPEAIAEAKGSKLKTRAPASVEEVDPERKIYSWETFSEQMDEAQR